MKEDEEKKVDVLMAMIYSFVVLAISWTVFGIAFETNDDTGIMMFVTGAKTGVPTAETIFCNIIWGWILSTLYRLNEAVPWYVGIYMILVFGAISILALAFIRLVNEYRLKESRFTFMRKYAVAFVLFGLSFVMFFLYYCVEFQFTVISAFCGMAAIFLMVMFSEGSRLSYLVALFFLIFADTIRPKIGYIITVAVIILAVACKLFKKSVSKIYILIVVAVQFTTYSVNAFYEYLNDWIPFRKFHRERWAWKDYIHPSFDEQPEIYEAVGWTNNLYKLADKWFFMDRRINTQAFSYLNSVFDTRKVNINIHDLNFITIKGLLSHGYFLALLISLMFAWLYFRTQQYKKLIGLGCVLLSLATILLFFKMTGRLPYRVLFAVCVVFVPPSFFLFFQDFRPKVGRGEMHFSVFLCYFFLLIWGTYVGNRSISNTSYVANSYEKASRMKTKAALERYAIDHQGNIYIYDISLALVGGPFVTYENGKPYNLMFWGGSGIYSPPFYDQLKANGLEELYPENFFEEDVYFVSREEPNIDLLEYMKEEFGDLVSEKIIYSGDQFIVYQFSK